MLEISCCGSDFYVLSWKRKNRSPKETTIKGSNMFFYALTSAGPPHPPPVMLKPEPETTQIVSDNHVWSLLLHKVILSCGKLWKNCFEKFIFVLLMAQKHEGCVGFVNACSRALKTYVILTSLKYDTFYSCYCWWRQFLWRPRMRVRKVQKPCINSMWIAMGFLPDGC